jgi:hypothetical protein
MLDITFRFNPASAKGKRDSGLRRFKYPEQQNGYFRNYLDRRVSLPSGTEGGMEGCGLKLFILKIPGTSESPLILKWE